MQRLTRRSFGRGLGALAAAAPAAVPRFAIAQAQPRVVIVGGGAGGATVASYLKRAAPNIHVTLIERNAQFTTCFFSNLYLGGFRSLESLTHSYIELKSRGINVVTDVVVDVDTARTTVTLISGVRIPYDRLVLSPGIDIRFDTIDGYTRDAAQTMPHAWRGGEQTVILRRQLEEMPDGGVVVLAPPPNPFRCPPGPYERACMIAHFLKTRKPRSKLIIFDPKRAISKQAVFLDAFKKYYQGIIEFNLSNEIDDFRIVSVDPGTRTVVTKSGNRVRANVANIVPAQKAGGIAYRAGCVEGDWCPIVPESFQSTLMQDVFVIGDSAVATDMPKSAFSANSQGKLVANHLAHTLAEKEIFPSRVRNTCWSLLAPNDSAKIGANYVVGTGSNGRKMLMATDSFVSQADDEPSERRENYEESLGWYSGMTMDMFGTPA
jgi:NADPH-dependent 2,4-dienoyl-CoA reductase/sulfur reductase-like enzyme